MISPLDEWGNSVLRIFNADRVEITDYDELLEASPANSFAAIGDNDEVRLLSTLSEDEMAMVGHWLRFLHHWENVKAASLHTSTQKLIDLMKSTGSETLGELHDRINNFGDEVEKALQGDEAS